MKLNFKQPALSQNSKYSLFLLGSVLLFILVVMFIVTPLYQENQKNSLALTGKRQKLAAYQTFAQQNQDYATFSANQRFKVQEAQKRIPDQVSIPDVLRDYSGKAEHTGVSITNIKTPSAAEIVKEGNAFAVPLKVKLTGNYYKIVDFLQQVEAGDRYAKLQQVGINGNEANGDLTVDTQLTVYALKKELKGTPTLPVENKSEATGLERVRERDKANMEALSGNK
jgi:Tfp pilus assembly protein PilO